MYSQTVIPAKAGTHGVADEVIQAPSPLRGEGWGEGDTAKFPR